ncbi:MULTISPECIES: N-methyl-L-tryptophan oxidase [Haloferax]|uniref:N-methyl-L-tryptophan oxidase n=1 Tax=Haloferax marinum TaxID=2666143 RepID=A0A6A8G6I8_9EURY|nr:MULTISPECIES: N-methyl-L-tryptophan oxidase [Haloferax]KAB1197821.1 N-methyl-L-tryptophan oxidase [Haloferax sp. CBA1150]MRW96880.1 N-methyl-L-tryptophan oxidase [Haloferax marinum]
MAVSSYDTIVVGVGGMGSAATYQLAKRGVDVLGLERYDVPHTRGSSHGDTRIFRLTQPEHPEYVPLAKRAHELWREVETESGTNLLTTTGSVHAGPAGGSMVEDSVRSCEAHDIDHEVLTGTELSERFPGYDLPDDHRGVYQPDGGFLACERATSAHVTQAFEHGATIRAREAVEDIDIKERGVTVTTTRGQYSADNLVLAAGAWAGKHLDFLSDRLTPQRRVLAWFQPEKPENFRPENFPVFSADVPEGSFYGFPVFDRPGFKIGRTPASPEAIDPDEWEAEPTLEDEERLRPLVEKHFPDAAGETVRLATCIVTYSDDGHFYLDTHPEYPHVSVAAGFTGHGYKFCSVVGEVLADFATQGHTNNPIGVHQFDGRL